jgi:virulence factor Mce-like protein
MHINTDRLKLEVKRARVPFLTLMALFACGAAATFIILKNQLVQWPWQSYYQFRAAVPDAKGIVPGQQEVRIAGVRVGVIKASDLIDGHAVLTLSIDPQYGPVYRDARLQLRPVTALQDMYVSIESRGHPSAGQLGSNEILPVDQSVSPVDISRVLNTFDPTVRQNETVLLDEMDRGLADHSAQLNAAFVQLAPFLHQAQLLTEAMSARQTELAQLVHNFSGLTGALSTRDRQITSLVSVGDQTLSTLATADQPLDATLGQLPPTLSEIQSSFATLRAAETHLDPALVALRPVADALKPGLVALQHFATAATPALAALVPSVHALHSLANVLAPTSSSLNQAFTQLQPHAPRLNDITHKISLCEPAIEDFFNLTLSVLKFAGPEGAIPRGELTFGADSASGPSPSLSRNPGCTS